MNKYEILYIIQNGIDDDQKSSTVEKYSKLVETLNGKVESVDSQSTSGAPKNTPILSTTKTKATTF